MASYYFTYGVSGNYLTLGASATRTIDKAGEVDLFYTYLSTLTVSRLVVTPLTGTIELAPAINDGGLVLPAGTDPLTLSGAVTQSGAYYAAITSRDGPATYRLSWETVPDDFPNAMETRGILSLGGITHGRIDVANDADWFAVNLTAGHAYRFTASGAGDTLDLRTGLGTYGIALSADGSFIAPQSTSAFYLNVKSAQAGDYVLAMSTPDDDIGNDAAHATALAVGATLGGKMDFLADVDALKLHLTKGHLYRLTMAAPGLADAAPRIDLDDSFRYKADLLASSKSAVGSGTASSLDFFALEDADVTASVSLDQRNAPTGYTLRYEDIGSDDFGDSAATAGRVAATGATGRLDGAHDVDGMRVSLPWGVTYEIRTGGALGSPSASGYGLLLGPAANLGSSTGADANVLSATAKPGEDIVFYVHDGAQRTGSYSVAFTKAVDDFSANPDTTGRLGMNASVSGTLESSADRDWFAIDLTAGTAYHFATQGPVWDLGIVDAAGKRLSDLDMSEGTGVALDFTPSASGRYYVEAGYQGGNLGGATFAPGKYSIHAGMANGTADDHPGPVVLAVGATTSGTVNSSADIDSVLFDLKAGHHYTFEESTRTGGPNGVYSRVQDVRLERVEGGAAVDYLAVSENNPALTPASDGHYRVSFTPLRDAYRPNDYRLDYTFKVVDHGTDDFPATLARPLVYANGSYDGAIETVGDTDGFRTWIGAGQTIVVTLKGRAQDGATPLAANNAKLMVDATPAGIHIDYGRADNNFVIVHADADAMLDLSVAARAGTGAYTLQLRGADADDAPPALLNGQDETVGTSHDLRLYFSETVGQATTAPTAAGAAPGYFTVRDAAGRSVVRYAADDAAHVHWQDKTVTITPDQTWQPGQAYTLSAGGMNVIDMTGNALRVPDLRFHTLPAATAPGAGDDVYSGTHLGRTIAGGAGIDSVLYSGTADGQTIRATGHGQFTVAATGAATDTLDGIERVLFSGQRDALALDIDGPGGLGGQTYRLYQAAFDRAPDHEGLGFWMHALEQGVSLRHVAGEFLTSPEFRQLYGYNTTNEEFATQLYKNVLHRAPDAEGLYFWLDALDHGAPRANLLVDFSESPENQAALAQLIGNGFAYTPYS